MRLPIWLTMGLPLTVVTAGILISACSSDKKIVQSTDDSGVAAGACAAAAGGFPEPSCSTDSVPPTCPNSMSCKIEAMCGNTSTCMPLADNAGKSVLDFRFRRLTVITPEALASGFIQNVVVDHGITLNAKQCGEYGDGAFNWLIRIDKTTGMVTTGGAPPSTDPFGKGYCFAKTTASGSGIVVGPVTAKVNLTGNTFSSDPVAKLNVPIFVNGDPNQLIILPLSNVSVSKVSFSADGNCIGGFNYPALDKDCADSRSDCSRWHTDGALGGYITLEEADNVPIPQLGNKTLCVMLTKSTPGPDNLHCKRNAANKIDFEGDYCSSTKSAGGCKDSYWLAATFAASAVKIDDGSLDPLCHGGISGDGGTDSGSGDAATD